MKHLLVKYNDLTLFDGPVNELAFSENDTGINLAGKMQTPQPSVGGGLADLFAAASRRKTDAMVEKGKADLASDAEVVDAE